MRQGYILPSFQRQGIVTHLLPLILAEINPHAEHIYVATRRVNKGAQALYERLGFKKMERSLHELPLDKYISYELHLQN